jgi:glycosyltransferase involved in cell wall biosynthesis
MLQSYVAWYSVGPGCLTRFIETGNYPSFSVFPSYLFLPQHHTGISYEGHKKVYGYQEWCTSKQSYDTVNEVMIPSCLLCPLIRISILISSYNTSEEYVKDCLNSIMNQVGLFYIEIVWCNDGSDEEHSMILENELNNTMNSSRFIYIKYLKTIQNCGLSECLSKGVLECSNEYIFRMDSDDIMTTGRISKQYKFMTDNPDIVICGGGIKMFDENGVTRDIFHSSEIKWVDFVDEENKPSWIMNHPTLCYKKSAILEIGNYNKNFYENNIMEDYDLELRFMKKYGVLYNIPEVLVYYRIHKEQISKKVLDKDKEILFRKILEKLIR